MADLNYAESYSRELANAYPYVLNFGALYATPNNNRYRMGQDGKTIYIPRITTTGRIDNDRDSIQQARRNFDNSWEPKRLTHERQWSTLVHPKDVDQTDMVTTIQNITQTFNEQSKFPEMDAYTVSQIYKLWTSADPLDASKAAMTASTTAPTAATILGLFDDAMTAMDEARVPPNGRILYVTPVMKRVIQNADKISRSYDVSQSGRNRVVDRNVSRLDEVELVAVPSTLMKTAYSFTQGYIAADNAAQINMFLVHPDAVITPVSYETVLLDPPSAGTGGKWYYYEESHEDVFILNKKQDAIWFNITAATGTYTAVVSPTGNPSTSGYYEKFGDNYFPSTDTTVDSNKTYYTKS